MLEVYPEMVTQLNNEAFASIVRTLDFGLRNQVNSLSLKLMEVQLSLLLVFYKVDFDIDLPCFLLLS